MKPENQQKLDEIFRAVFAIENDQDVRALRQLDLPAWDSLAHVNLVTAIELELGVELDAAEQFRMTSYGATALLLEEKGQ